MKKINIGIQMYSVRDALSKDFIGTLRKVKEIGYDYVEFAGYYGGYTGEELKALLDEIGLKSVSVHQGIDMFLKEGQAAFDFFKAYGIRYIVIPWYDKNLLAGTEAWNSTKESFKKVSAMARENGMELLYHNHDFEFTKIGEEYLYDIMFRELDGYVNPQPDTCWMNYGGVNPSAYLRKYGDRIHVVHLKDFVCTKLAAGPVYALIDENGKELKGATQEENGFMLVPLGKGRNDFAEILDACSEIGVEYAVVEQDNFTGIEPIEAMAESRNYLKEKFSL